MSASLLLDASTWSPRLSELVEAFQVSLLPYNLELNYDYWNYCMYVWHQKPRIRLWISKKGGVAHSLPRCADDIMSAILPESEQDDLPTGFSIVGHIGACRSFLSIHACPIKETPRTSERTDRTDLHPPLFFPPQKHT